MKLTFCIGLLVLLCLVSCGGSGGGGPAPPPPNNPPTADAGADQTVGENTVVQLRGVGADPDGGALTYSWSQVSGPSVNVTPANAANANVTAPIVPIGLQENVVLRLTVRDNRGAEATDEVTLIVESADYLVFIADKDTDGVRELYKYETQVDSLSKLSGTLAAGGRVRSFLISPDGSHIAYRADQDVATRSELYVAARDGSGVTKLNAPMSNPAGIVYSYRWAPDSSQLVYTADADILARPETYLVTRDGSGHRKISGDINNGSVFLARPGWSPDGRYIAQLVVDPVSARNIGINTHDTTAGGRNSVRAASATAQGDIIARAWSPDSTRIAYLALDDAGTANVYVAMADGSGSTIVSGPLARDGDVNQFAWSPDGTRIAYIADQNLASRHELFTVLPDGSSQTRINLQLPARNDDVLEFKWAPDGSAIGYRATQAGNTELIAADPVGGNTRRVSAPFSTVGGVSGFRWAPDSATILYAAIAMNAQAINAQELYTADAGGGATAKVNGPLPTGGNAGFVHDFDPEMWAPDGSLIAYLADQIVAGTADAFVSSPDGTGTVRVNPTPVAGGALEGPPYWSADSSAVAYLARQDDPNKIELYLASADGSRNMRVSGPLVADGNVTWFGWSP